MVLQSGSGDPSSHRGTCSWLMGTARQGRNGFVGLAPQRAERSVCGATKDLRPSRQRSETSRIVALRACARSETTRLVLWLV